MKKKDITRHSNEPEKISHATVMVDPISPSIKDAVFPLLLATILPSIFIVRELMVGGKLGFPLDDSWIHLVFARNIAHGDFFSFNPHSPVAGSTAPLWSILLGAGYAITHSPLVMPKVVGIILHVLLTFISWRLALLIGATRPMAIVAAALVACTPRLVWASVSGMEVSLYDVMGLWAIDLYLRYHKFGDLRAYWGWAMGGIASWARPEMMVLPVFFALHVMITRDRHSASGGFEGQSSSKPYRYLITGLLIAAVCAAPFFILNEWLSGTMLPLTFYAKTGPRTLTALLAGGNYLEIVKQSGFSLWFANIAAWKWHMIPDNLFLALMALPGAGWIIWLFLRRGEDRTENDNQLVLLALILFLYVPIRSMVTNSPNFFQYGRYCAILSPVMLLFVSVWMERQFAAHMSKRGFITLTANALLCSVLLAVYYASVKFIGRGHQSPSLDLYLPFLEQATFTHVAEFFVMSLAIAILWRAGRVRAWCKASIMPLLVTQFLVFTLVEDQQVATEYAWNVRNINDTEVKIGQWLRTALPAGATYATNDIGAMAFFADSLRVVDVMGLVNKEVQEKLRQTGSMQLAALWALQAYHPVYFICFNEWYPNLVRAGLQLQSLHPTYGVKITNNITCGGRGVSAMYVYSVDYDHLPDLVALAARHR